MRKSKIEGNLIVDIEKGRRARILLSTKAFFQDHRQGSRFRWKYLIAALVCVGPVLSAFIHNTF